MGGLTIGSRRKAGVMRIPMLLLVAALAAPVLAGDAAPRGALECAMPPGAGGGFYYEPVIKSQTLLPQPASFWIAGIDGSTAAISRVGTGVYGGGWPGPLWGRARHEVVARGTLTTPVAEGNPMVLVSSHADGPFDELYGNTGEMVVYSSRTNGEPSAMVAAAVPLTPGYSAITSSAHVLMQQGVTGAHATGWAFWGTCQNLSYEDACSVMELNPINLTGNDPPNEGEYVNTGRLMNALGLIAGPPFDPNFPNQGNKSSSAVYIGSQNLPRVRFQRGIDFQQGSIAHYAIVLPNDAPVVYRSRDDSAKVPVVNLSALDDVELTTAGSFLFRANGVVIATLDGVGNLSVAGAIRPVAVAFALLGGAGAPGTMKYCTNCTATPTCGVGGGGHLAVSDGTQWRCQ